MMDTEGTSPLSVEEARALRVCRICREPIRPSGVPAGWPKEFGEMVYPIAITLNFGDEFAHTACLPPVSDPLPTAEEV